MKVLRLSEVEKNAVCIKYAEIARSIIPIVYQNEYYLSADILNCGHIVLKHQFLTELPIVEIDIPQEVEDEL